MIDIEKVKNFILNKQDKKEFMEIPGCAFSIHIQAGTSEIGFEKIIKSKEIVARYEGCLATFEEFQQNLGI